MWGTLKDAHDVTMLSPPLSAHSPHSSLSSPYVHRQGRAAILLHPPSLGLPTPAQCLSIMEKFPIGSSLPNDTACIALLDELQGIWNDVGESDVEKDLVLQELEKECVEIYRRKVDQANGHRAQLQQAIADHEAEIVSLCFAMGEIPVHFRQSDRSLKEELTLIVPRLEEMRERKKERLSQFLEVAENIRHLSAEINPEHVLPEVDLIYESDLSLKKLNDLYRQLDVLQKEKSDRLRKVADNLNILKSLCSVLHIDFRQTACEVHHTFDGPDESKNVSCDTIEKLTRTIQRLHEVKLHRMHKVQDLVTAMLEMWHLMDTPVEEQQQFQDVTCNIAASEHEITEPNSLSIEFINLVETEVKRLEELKASRMKDLVLRKKLELDDICRRAHLVPETDNSAEFVVEAIETESIDPSVALEQIEAQISIVKEEAYCRKDILDRVEKWLSACEEESWLEEYNRDENRYNAGRGTHLMLKHAEKARVVVSKIPGIVDNLTAKIMSWENERGSVFIYDGSNLLSMLEEYTIMRQEREQERKRHRDQRRLQVQLTAEQDVMFGSKSSPRSQSVKKLTTLSGGPTRRQSIGGVVLQSPKFDSLPSFKYPSSSKKEDALFAGIGDSELPFVECEGETAQKPLTSSSQPRTAPSTKSWRSTCDAEEENITPGDSMFVPEQAIAGPVSIGFDDEASEVKNEARPEVEVSFEERRLELLLKCEE